MTTAQKRSQLKTIIDKADNKKIVALYNMFEEGNSTFFTKSQTKELDERYNNIKNGKATFYTLDEVMNNTNTTIVNARKQLK